MTPTRVRVLAASLASAAVLVTAALAGAQPFDHLECYKIKDNQAKKKYTATLTPEQTQFLAQSGCTIKVPAKHLCVQSAKSNVVPAPPNAIAGQTARAFLCYKVKCQKNEFAIPYEDQFGTRTVNVKKPDRLCAPAREVGFPDPPTPTPCLAPTPTPPTCIDGLLNGGESDVDCGGPCPPCQDGQMCGFPGDCQSGNCQGGVCQPACVDIDNDMFDSCVDCDDTDAAVNPNAAEVCNGIDDDCDGQTDEGGGLCPVPNGQQACIFAVCQGAPVCDPGYADCDAFAGNGCEVAITSDPANCGGCGFFCSGSCVSGQCLQANGSSCLMNANCLSGFCVDGYCCNSACSGQCVACNGMFTTQPNGTCSVITPGTDPNGECPGTSVCDGMGFCTP